MNGATAFLMCFIAGFGPSCFVLPRVHVEARHHAADLGLVRDSRAALDYWNFRAIRLHECDCATCRYSQFGHRRQFQ